MAIQYLDDFDARNLAKEVSDLEPEQFIAIAVKGNTLYALARAKSKIEGVGMAAELLHYMQTRRAID